jgi:lipid II isoglutaminyl synthase (glutamine-hydrolysing)
MNIAVAIGKLLRAIIRLFRRGGGSALPGLVASRLDPNLLRRSLKFQSGVVLVTGSAGKSSTTKLLVELLQAQGLRVFTNPSTANIEQGLVSAVLQQSDIRGRLSFDIAVLEVDEGHGAALAELLKPKLTVFTNLMVDQLDRFVDPDLVLEKLSVIAGASGEIVVNADDANLDSLGAGAGFGSVTALRERPDYPEYAPVFAVPSRTPALVITDVRDSAMTYSLAGQSYTARLPGVGVHVALNAAAALLAASQLLGEDFDAERACALVSSTKPVFARDEHLTFGPTPVRLMLVQNPGSFRLNLSLLGQPERLMIAIGSDVHDPAWLWSVDFSGLKRVHLVSGSNAHEIGLRLAYQGVAVDRVDSSVEAVDAFLAGSGTTESTIMVSADAMRRMRRHLRLAK